MKRFTIEFTTQGNDDVINLSPELLQRLSGIPGEGLVHLFATGSTAGITTLEYEPGLVRHDLHNALQRLVPDDARYEHEATWNDDNGHSHIRSALIGCSLTVPFAHGKLLTGEYQQIVFIDFDTRPRRRSVVVTVMTQ